MPPKLGEVFRCVELEGKREEDFILWEVPAAGGEVNISRPYPFYSMNFFRPKLPKEIEQFQAKELPFRLRYTRKANVK
jgi:hypothetical protein